MPDPNPTPQRPAQSPRRRWHRLLPWLGLAIIAGLIAIGFAPRPLAVETATVNSGPLRATVNEEGKTRIKQRFVVSAPVAGKLRRTPLKPGALVQAGNTIVALLDPLAPTVLDARSRTQATARRDAARAALDRAAESRDLAQRELKRLRPLHTAGVLSAQDLDTAETRSATTTRDHIEAAENLRAAEAELEAYPTQESTLPPIELKAPVSGAVLRVFEESSRPLPAGTPILEVGDPNDIEIVVEALSRDGAAITPGTKVYLEQWGGSKPLLARVRLVEPAAFTKISALGVEEQRVNVVADLATPPEDRRGLGDNFRVEARIVTWESERVLKVPAGALFRHGPNWAAYLLKNGKAILKTLTVGPTSGVETQVIDGIQEGDTVILYPGERIHDGLRVTPVTVSP